MRGVWRCTCRESGVPSAMTSGGHQMLRWCAGSWDSWDRGQWRSGPCSLEGERDRSYWTMCNVTDGTELYLTDFESNPPYMHNCNHAKTAGVRCRGEPRPLTVHRIWPIFHVHPLLLLLQNNSSLSRVHLNNSSLSCVHLLITLLSHVYTCK